MCIAFWSLSHPVYSLVLCANRDEFLWRPTLDARWHSFESLQEDRDGASPYATEGFVLSGRDIVAGGTWLGINRDGNVALLTNITEPKTGITPSRGHLTSSFLLQRGGSSESELRRFVDEVTSSETRYAGFNMLLLSPKRSWRSGGRGAEEGELLEFEGTVLSNNGAGNPIESYPLSEASDVCGCISNDSMSGVDTFTGLVADEEWPKAANGRVMLSEILSGYGDEDEDVLIERLFEMLRVKKDPPPRTLQGLRETIMVDVIDMMGLKDERLFATVAAGNAHRYEDVPTQPAASLNFATRLASILLVRKDGTVVFVERDVWVDDAEGRPVLIDRDEKPGLHERRYSYKIER